MASLAQQLVSSIAAQVGKKIAQVQPTLQDSQNAAAMQDWRVRLSLANNSDYLYNDPENILLAPLAATGGVIFPYTPTISVSYNASYNSVTPASSNYKIFQYESSNVDNINITCEFTAQDTYEANYILAVIHFFRSVTKMFYGQDENPKPGTPPPLCFLTGMGEFQFNNHPLAITSFQYNLPNDVDYIRAGTNPGPPGTTGQNQQTPKKTSGGSSIVKRLEQIAVTAIGNSVGKVVGNLLPGGGISKAGALGLNKGFNSLKPPGTESPTYVPTKIQISISCIPVVSRYDVSNVFSLKDYANGALIKRGTTW